MRVDRRRVIIVGGALVAAVAIVWGLDALVVTDEERLEDFVDDVTGTVTAERIDRALEWVDPATEPVEVRLLGRAHHYDTMQPLRERAHDSLAFLQGSDLRTLQSGIQVADDRAEVSLRLLTDRGMLQVSFGLRRHGERWLVREVDVHR